jgi:hypothetical protein
MTTDGMHRPGGGLYAGPGAGADLDDRSDDLAIWQSDSPNPDT